MKGEGAGPEPLAPDIADAVESLTNLWSLAAQEASLRLSLQQLRALRVVERSPGVNLTGLAERLDMGSPTASRLCDRLEAAGLLERALHPHNRREVRLSLTPHGHHVLADIAAQRARALGEALGAMAPPERAALLQGLRAFLAIQDPWEAPSAET